jgi:predicted lipoprotein
VLVFSACSDGGGSTASSDGRRDADRAAIIAAVTDAVILPAYHDLADMSSAALASARDLCADPTAASRDAAATAIAAARDAYLRLDPIDFGPIMDLRAASQLGYRPDPDRIDELLATDPPTDVETITTRTPASTRGFGAAEHLVDADVEAFATPGFAPAGFVQTRCAYLLAVLEAADSVVQSIDSGWFTAHPAYAEQVAGRGLDPIPHKEILDIVVNMALEALGADSVALVAETRDGGASAEFVRISARHLDTIAALWGAAGTGSGTGTGLRDMVDSELADQLAAELATAAAAATEGDGAATLVAIDAVRATLGSEVVAALDVVVGFSENDGDS